MESNSVDLTKPIQGNTEYGYWSEVPIEAKYIETVRCDGNTRYVVRCKFSDGDVLYSNTPEEMLNHAFRNVRTLAERCREELQGATEVRVWGVEVREPGSICKRRSHGDFSMVATGVLEGDIYKVLDNFMLESRSAYVTPVHWTPEEAAQLAQELGL